MRTRIIGDIHGSWHEYHNIASEAETSIQVGDFGIGFSGTYWHERVNDFHRDGKHRFIRGNHDNPKMCKHEMVGYISDGFVENDIMFVGGAWSIDWAMRIEGVSWWRDEECSSREFERIISIYETVRPRVMITHDAPLKASKEMFFNSGLLSSRSSKQIKTLTGQAFDIMLELHQPEEWYFGHWHFPVSYKCGRTFFRCLSELEYVDVDL